MQYVTGMMADAALLVGFCFIIAVLFVLVGIGLWDAFIVERKEQRDRDTWWRH